MFWIDNQWLLNDLNDLNNLNDLNDLNYKDNWEYD
jgi:hypothetical protein